MKAILSNPNAYKIAVSEDESILACLDRTAPGTTLIDLNTNSNIGLLKTGAKCLSIALSDDGRFLASGQYTIAIWDTTTQKKILSLKGHKHNVNDIKFSPDGSKVVTISGEPRTPHDHTLRIWDMNDGKCLTKIKFPNLLTRMAWQDHNTLITLGNGILSKIDLRNNEITALQSKLGRYLAWNGSTKAIITEEYHTVLLGIEGAVVFDQSGKFQHLLRPKTDYDLSNVSGHTQILECPSNNYLTLTAIYSRNREPIESLVIKWDEKGQEVDRKSIPHGILGASYHTKSGNLYFQNTHGEIIQTKF